MQRLNTDVGNTVAVDHAGCMNFDIVKRQICEGTSFRRRTVVPVFKRSHIHLAVTFLVTCLATTQVQAVLGVEKPWHTIAAHLARGSSQMSLRQWTQSYAHCESWVRL